TAGRANEPSCCQETLRQIVQRRPTEKCSVPNPDELISRPAAGRCSAAASRNRHCGHRHLKSTKSGWQVFCAEIFDGTVCFQNAICTRVHAPSFRKLSSA